MKLRVTFKTPDALGDAVNEAVAADMAGLSGFDGEELDAIREVRVNKAYEACRKWVQWGEYVTIVIDTDAGTAEVAPAK